MRNLLEADSADVPTFTPPNVAQHMFDWPDEMAEVEAVIVRGLQKVRCPKCTRPASPHEVSLWLDPDEQRVRFLCSGCRTTINRRQDTPYKDQILMCLQAHGVDVPDKVIQWMRVQCRIAEHPGDPAGRKTVEVDQQTGEISVVEVFGARKGIRAGIGVVD